MATALPATGTRRLHQPLAMGMQTRWVIGLTLGWAIVTWLTWNMPLNNDVSWQLWVARQLRHGADFYRDITEPNPPLWFWEAMPVDALAEHLHIATRHILVAAITAQIALAAGLIASLSTKHHIRRAAIAATALFGLSLLSFGEREHLLVIAVLPYALLVARRAEHATIPARLALAIGVFAGLGVALKPHFLAVPLLLEIWLAVRQRRDWRPVRIETIALFAILVAYAITALLFARAYFTSELPELLGAYGDFKPPFASLWFGQPFMLCWALMALAWALAGGRKDSAVATAATATLAFVMIYAVQAKGFGYHALPVTTGCAWTCWLILETEQRRAARLLAIMTMASAVTLSLWIGPFKASELGTITPRLRTLPAGSTVAVVSAHSWNAFPLIEDQRFVWPMHEISEWTMPAIARTGPDTPLAHRTRDAIVADLWCHPPDAILFDDPARSYAMPRNGFDYRRFVAADPRAAALLAHYRDVDRVGGATLLFRNDSLAPRGTACRTVVLRPDDP
jgi:hypothetical protein